MRDFTRRVMLAVAPVFGVFLSIAVLQAAHLPFPPEASTTNWAHWIVFASVVHTATALCLFGIDRLFSAKPSGAPPVTSTQI